MKYENYIFDLYGTLVDIHTDEEKPELWEKLAQFYGYYGAAYTAQKLKNAYARLTGQKEDALRQEILLNGENRPWVYDFFRLCVKYITPLCMLMILYGQISDFFIV